MTLYELRGFRRGAISPSLRYEEVISGEDYLSLSLDCSDIHASAPRVDYRSTI